VNRLLGVALVATLAMASMLAPTVARPAKATEELTLSHETLDRVLKMRRGLKKSRAAKVTSSRAKVGTGDGKYIIRKLPGRAN
jgi:hypothetical protein